MGPLLAAPTFPIPDTPDVPEAGALKTAGTAAEQGRAGLPIFVAAAMQIQHGAV
jgi:hypothetical protein